MQAILTRYHGPTDYHGARITARCEAGKVTIPYPHELSGEAVHRAAAIALCSKLGWNPDHLIAGALPDSSPDSYAFVFHSNARS